MSGKKCKHCGSSEIEVDPARGDAVCTSCGTVLEDNIIVSEVEFTENAHGGASAIGQFVSAESKGGATGFGRAFTVGIGQESREVTLRKAREGITLLCQQLRINQQCIDIACNFYKMALSMHLTFGRPTNHTQAACIYITCRTEGTPHLLIDVSDAASICCYQLGRTYFKLSRALCINVPPNDPCLYILRFASQLEFEEKQHEVSMTALRLVQRMKRDSIHSGRRPSGICGAALLIAARLHEFSRQPADLVRIVKVHESTLRKRLLEFGDTPSSALTLDEFMTVDLEEDQDPPSFRAARKRDKERLQKLLEEEDGEKELTDLQTEIEKQLEKGKKRKNIGESLNASSIISLDNIEESSKEFEDASRFAVADTLAIIDEFSQNTTEVDEPRSPSPAKNMGPTLASIGLERTVEPPKSDQPAFSDLSQHELVMSDGDEDYIDGYIMDASEQRDKAAQWYRVNGGYLKEQKIKQEIRARELEDNKGKKKVRGSYKKKVPLNAATASEAVGKMLAERKISSKINYDILRSLDQSGAVPSTPKAMDVDVKDPVVAETTKPEVPATVPASPVPRKKKKKNAKAPPTPTKPATPATPATPANPATPATPAPATPSADMSEDFEEELDDLPAPVDDELSLAAILRTEQDDYDYDYEEY